MHDPNSHNVAPAAAKPRSRPARRALKISLGVIAGLLVVIVAAVALLLVNANLLRGPIARFVSAKLERPFAINGDLRIGLFKHPHVEVNGIVLGNAAWGSQPNMVEVERALVSIKLSPLLHRRVVLPEVRLTKPNVLLERDADGEANWQFGKAEDKAPSESNPPEIQALWIDNGKVALRDPIVETNLAVALNSERGNSDAESIIRFSGEGSLRNEEFRLKGQADSLLELTEAGKPYRVQAQVSAGSTSAAFNGTVVPLKLETIDGDIELRGKDLSQLYPIVPVPLPWTPAYRISGHLVRDAKKVSLRDLKGKVGSSDIHGIFAVDLSSKRPVLSADLTSKRLDYKDLAGFLNAPPPKGKATTAAQRQEVAKREESGRVFATKPYNLKALRSLDADVKFKGESIIARDIPLDKIAVHLKLDDGVLELDPLNFGLAGGNVVSNIVLDASHDVIRTDADATVKNLEVKRLMPKMKEGAGSAGKLGGRVKLATRGNSPAQMAASANGELALIMGQGRLSTIALVLTNLDLANAVKYVVRGNPNAPVYCAVINASVKDGMVAPNIFVIDSSEEKITGEGFVDLKSEEYKLRLVAQSKKMSLIALRGPINISGTFKDPKVMPEVRQLALRAGAAIALGTLLTPPAALLALIDPGGAKDSNCAGLVNEAQQHVAKKQVEPPKKAAPVPETAGGGDNEKEKATR